MSFTREVFSDDPEDAIAVLVGAVLEAEELQEIEVGEVLVGGEVGGTVVPVVISRSRKGLMMIFCCLSVGRGQERAGVDAKIRGQYEHREVFRR